MENRSLLISLTVIVLMAVGLFLLYRSNPEIAKLIDQHILGKTVEVKQFISNEEMAIFFIADNTGSMKKYNIPQLTTTYIEKAIDELHLANGGCLFVSSFDSDIRNNENLYFRIPSKLFFKNKPARGSGETYFEYDRRIKKWEQEKQNYLNNSLSTENDFNVAKKQYIDRCEKFLAQLYGNVTKENNATNVADLLDAAIHSLNERSDKHVQKIIIGYSDFEETVNWNRKKMYKIPQDIKIIQVNPVPGTTKKKISADIIEVHPDRLFETIFN